MAHDSTPSTSTPPILASSLIVLRDGSSGLEVLMVRRATTHKFMAGVYVFPGGRLDAADRAAEPTKVWVDGGVDAPAVDDLDGDDVRTFLLAGVREAVEEAGILVGGDAPLPPTEVDRLRTAAHESAETFYSVLMASQWQVRASALSYWSRWITPKTQPKRFDARFFVVQAPAEQDALEDQGEVTDARWSTPADFLAEYFEKTIGLGPPQIYMLHELSAFASVAEAVASVANRPHPRLPMLPQPLAVAGEDGQPNRLWLLFPGDSEYPQPELRGEGTFRARREDGLWRLEE